MRNYRGYLIKTGWAVPIILALVGCQPGVIITDQAVQGGTAKIEVLAVEPFLADLASEVAGDRLTVKSLIPAGLDPHSYEPTPQDIAKISESQVLVINGGGLEHWLGDVLENRPDGQVLIEVSQGLEPRQPQPGEMINEAEGEIDPHFWLDPTLTIHYVENLRDGLTRADPEGEQIYSDNASQSINRLQELDRWIRDQVALIPVENRLLVTNHESLGYFADQYGFKIVGTLIPSVSTNASPSAQLMAQLIDQVKATGAKAIFLEVGVNENLARQLSADTGIQVVTNLSTHSMSSAAGENLGYIDMMKHDVQLIVDALR